MNYLKIKIIDLNLEKQDTESHIFLYKMNKNGIKYPSN